MKIYLYLTLIDENGKQRLRPLPYQTFEDGRPIIPSLNVQADATMRRSYPLGTVFASNLIEERSSTVQAFYAAGDIFPVSVQRSELKEAGHEPTPEMKAAYTEYVGAHAEEMSGNASAGSGVLREQNGRPLSLLSKMKKNPRFAIPTIKTDGFWVDEDTWWDLMVDLYQNENILFKGPAGSGKCLGKDTPILMYDGTIKMVQNVKTGDLLMGPDSKPRKVLSTTTGREELFEITPNHGNKWVCNKSHILSLQRNVKKNGKTIRKELWNVPVTEWIENHNGTKKEFKQWTTPIDFNYKPIKIEPYFLGLWLGDGRNDSATVCTPDLEIVNYLNDYAKRLGMKISVYPENSKANSYAIVKQGGKNTRTRNTIQMKMDKYDLFNNKHIPLQFLTNTRKNRLELLAGLLDTDGYYDKRGNDYEFCSKDKRLTDQFAYLCRSLGFRCTVKEKTVKGKTYYRAWVYGHVETIPTRVERKKAHPGSHRVDPCHTGFSVKSIGEGDYYGFVIDGDHLFVLGDFTVTHNTELVMLAARKLGLDCHVYDMGSMYDPISDLLGVHRMTAQGSVFDYAQFTQDIQKEGIILLDELSRATPAVNNILMPCLDSRRTLRVEMAGGKDVRSIPVHPKCRFAATANLGAGYVGANELDVALRDRFEEFDMTYMPQAEEIELLATRYKIPRADATNIVKAANNVRDVAAKGDLELSVTTRETIRAAKKVAAGYTAQKAMERTFLPRFEGTLSEGSRSVVWQIIISN